MLTHYLVLDISFDASDKDIRKKYIELVKKYTPEKDPASFRKITEAYEAIKDEHRRIEAKIFGGFNVPDFEAALYALIKAREIKRRRVGLEELVQAANALTVED